MGVFRFRMQTALDLRVRQEDEAKAALAAAETARREAEQQRDAARAALDATLARSREAESRTGDVTERLWYRNWIVAQRHEVERRQQALVAREAIVREATSAAQAAHQKRRILERLKDRAAASFGAEEHRQEQKVFDELGTLRFTIATRGDDL
jgi:flagellar FliJ protein